jgi:hypothetical protein
MAERDRFELDLAAAMRAYLEEAPTEVRPTELARHFATAHPHGTTTFGPWRFAAIPHLAWVLLLVAALLAALVGGMLLAGSRLAEPWPRRAEPLPRHPAELVQTGVDKLRPVVEGGPDGGAVADPSGAVWVRTSDALGRLDPVSGAVRTWTFADDAAFGDVGIVPARGEGVWLVPPANGVDQALRWFDGERYRDIVPAPPSGPVGALAEAPDGSLWSGGATGLFHWDGTSWSDAPEGRPSAGVSALAVDRSGAVWVGNCDYNAAGACSERGLSRYDGTRWETFADVATPNWIRQAPDGSIWVEGGADLVRYDGHAWTQPGGDWPLRPGRLTWAADGTAWVVTECTWDGPVGEVLVAHYDGSAWEEYTAADGVPSTNCEEVLATAHGVYVGTGDGLYRLVGDRWEHVWPSSSATQPTRDPRPLYRTMTTVVNGRVLLVGIEVSDLRIEQYQFVTKGLLATARSGYAAARLADGRVLILGGIGALDDPLASAEIWDPTTGTVRQTGSMAAPRVAPIATLLGDGRVLVAGGAERVRDPALASAELYDPAVGTFSPVEGR